ncbi:MAG: cobalamin-binding protein [Pyrinomonadaceae bacterium]|nr:cobalamin-binding protein [Pyrinomonadaceae bacterium]
MLKENRYSRCLIASCALIICAAFAFSSCGLRNKTNSSTSEVETREVKDETGKSLRVPVRIERVVSLAPNLTEIIYAVGAGNRLVGNTSFCDYPPAAKEVTKVGDTIQPNIERIIALRPQLVLVSTASQLEAFTRQMQEQGIPVYVTDPRDLEAVFRNLQMLGELFGESDRAAQVINELRARVAKVEATVKDQPPVKVFYQVEREPLYTAGRESFLTDLIRRAGGKSVTAEVPGAWPTFSDEAALASQPEAIIMPTYGSMKKESLEIAGSLKTSPAAKQGRVYGINGDLLSRPGPRLVDGLEEMARKLHPNVFR